MLIVLPGKKKGEGRWVREDGRPERRDGERAREEDGEKGSEERGPEREGDKRSKASVLYIP